MGSDSCPPGLNAKRSSFSRLAGRAVRRCALVRARRSAGLVCVVWGGVSVARVPSPPVVPCPCLSASPYPVARASREILCSKKKKIQAYR
eukprot:691523-Prymnesium_polylepis.2